MHLPLVKDIFGSSGINVVEDDPENDSELPASDRLQLLLLIMKCSLLPVGIQQTMSHLKYL